MESKYYDSMTTLRGNGVNISIWTVPRYTPFGMTQVYRARLYFVETKEEMIIESDQLKSLQRDVTWTIEDMDMDGYEPLPSEFKCEKELEEEEAYMEMEYAMDESDSDTPEEMEDHTAMAEHDKENCDYCSKMIALDKGDFESQSQEIATIFTNFAKSHTM